MYKNIQDQLRQKEREAHLEETKNFSSKIQQLFKKANEHKLEQVVERKQLDSSIVNTWEYKINSLVRAIKESYAKMQIGEFQFYNIISTYNDACIYLKNIVKYTTLNQNYKIQFEQDFRKVLPALQDIEYYAIQVKNISEPAIQEMIKNIENKTYNTIGAELGVRTLKSGTLEKQLLLNKITSLKEFIKKNKDKVNERAQIAELKAINTALSTMKTKLSPNSVDWNRIEQTQKKIDALNAFNGMNTAVDNIIQPLLDAEEKEREEEKRKKAEEEAERARVILETQQKAIEEEKKQEAIKVREMYHQIFEKLLNGIITVKSKIQDPATSEEEKIELNKTLKSFVEKYNAYAPKSPTPFVQKVKLQNALKGIDLSDNVAKKLEDEFKNAVEVSLNQPNNDQAQQNAPVIVQGDTEKKDPSITLQLNTPPPQEEVKVEVKAPEPVQNQANDKQQLLNDNPWLAEVDKDIIYSDFMAYAGNKRRDGLSFNTSLNWAKFKEYYDR